MIFVARERKPWRSGQEEIEFLNCGEETIPKISVGLKMAGTKCHEMLRNGTNWHEMAHGTKWHKIAQNGYKIAK